MSFPLEALLSATGLVDSQHLHSEVEKLSEYLTSSSFRIAVFAPFNHGKSTLLNALLGNRALPIDLVPTTGTAIVIKYGDELSTCIRTTDGQEICEAGTDILQKFAILDDNRRMREDIESVEVICPHPLLKMGIEMIDLPGTDDMEAQDNLVYKQLLMVDLVIQVLDARKLFTLGEVSKLQDWLINRGIKTSIFVLNFMNLLDRQDHKEVLIRARSIAGEFRGILPDNISNLYRVDALPALRSRIKGDVSLSTESGILAFESALQQIIDSLFCQVERIRLPRLVSIAEQVKLELQNKSTSLEYEVKKLETNHALQIHQIQKNITQIKQSFESSISNFKEWCSITNLLTRYKSDAAASLQRESFRSWETGDFKRVLTSHQESVMKYIYQACNLLNHPYPKPLSISFPADPSISKPAIPSTAEPTKKSVAIAAGVGWLLAGPIGSAVVAGITHAVNENTKKSNATAWDNYRSELASVCSQGATEYLKRFSDKALEQIRDFEKSVEGVFTPPSLSAPTHIVEMRSQLSKLLIASNALDQWLQSAEIYHSD